MKVFPCSETPQKASNLRLKVSMSAPPDSFVGSTQAICQIFATFPGCNWFTRMARPRIWLEVTNEPTNEARTKVLIAGASQPSPKSDLVPISTSINPSSKSWVMALTISFLPLTVGFMTMYSVSQRMDCVKASAEILAVNSSTSELWIKIKEPVKTANLSF